MHSPVIALTAHAWLSHLLREYVDTLGAQMLLLGVEGTHVGSEVEIQFHAAEVMS